MDVHGHSGAYPVEELVVNDKHVHVEDKEPTNLFTPHSFDSHPVMEHYNTPPKNHGSEQHSNYLDDHKSFHGDNGGVDQYFDSIEQRDPTEHEARGQKKASPIHGEVDKLDLDSDYEPEAVSAKPEEQKAQPSSSDLRAQLDAIKARVGKK